jgi:type I restriction enzyme R subunit
MRTMVRDLLDRYGYPPDFSSEAIDLIVRQAEVMSEDLMVGASADGGWA